MCWSNCYYQLKYQITLAPPLPQTQTYFIEPIYPLHAMVAAAILVYIQLYVFKGPAPGAGGSLATSRPRLQSLTADRLRLEGNKILQW